MIVAVTYFLCKTFVYSHDSDAEFSYVFCFGVLTYIAMLQAFQHGYQYICFALVSNVHNAFVFLHFYICIVQRN